jgi:hypothetical protein
MTPVAHPAADSEEAAPCEPDPARLPPPDPRAPPRACSKVVGEMKARAADASGRRCGQNTQ